MPQQGHTQRRILAEKFGSDMLERLSKHGEIVVVDPWREQNRWTKEASRADAIVSRKGRITAAEMRESRGRLKIIARTGVGVDVSRVDVEAATEHGVWVTNNPGVNASSVAELVFGFMIMLARKLVPANEAVKDNRWSDYLKLIGTEVASKTLGIIGMGHIGTRLALRARAFEMEVLVCDPYIPESHIEAIGAVVAPLSSLLSRSDFVSIHCPLNAETRHMIAEPELRMMKPTGFLINAARGGIVDEHALYLALSGERIAGAAVDVMTDEPPPAGHPLFQLPNVILTPHVGGSTAEAIERGEKGAAHEVIRVLSGERPLHPVNEIQPV